MDVSPRRSSRGGLLIPFLEHDDANRARSWIQHAASGADTPREKPLVGTHGAGGGKDSGVVVRRAPRRVIESVDAAVSWFGSTTTRPARIPGWISTP